ncbi:TIGR03619 family F420-dependent LLM class oxidoreductase [Salinibacterium sp. ZJ454]|uniref:TIGR03619 family F420-dependent LLM class oxidoreductase n=1 Tax=Salinibacterium sp. ZJ454 TaxID=2708339 RepID=UPI001423BE67|nr:TIGR03619 family F420-dependent LLM class oxidoreductase [Salinibacterium sp. ZJ454]
MEYWLQCVNTLPEDIVELAVLAEECGFAGIMEGDHWLMPASSDDKDPHERGSMPWDYSFSDVFVTAGAVLQATTRLRFAPGVLVLANRTNPVIVAKSCATASRISGGRFALGVGLGWMKEEYDVAGVDFSTRVPRTVEMIEILRKLWGPGPVEHHGRFFDFPPTHNVPRPEHPLPIYVGAYVPQALRRAGRIGDGWMAAPGTVEELAASIAIIDEARRDAGRDHEQFEVFAGLKRNHDGSLPGRDDFRRAEDIGVTAAKFGPFEHMLGEPYVSMEDKRRWIENFAERVITA